MAVIGEAVPTRETRPLRGRLLVLAVVLHGCCILVELLLLGGVLHLFAADAQREGGATGWLVDIDTAEPSVLVTAISTTVSVATLVCVLVLLTRAYRNAAGPYGALPVRPAWFVLSWLVPWVNLVAPYTLMRFTFDRLLGPASRTLLRWWWAAWVTSSIAAYVAPTTHTSDGRHVVAQPFAVLMPAAEIAFRALTVVVLVRLAAAVASTYRRVAPPAGVS